MYTVHVQYSCVTALPEAAHLGCVQYSIGVMITVVVTYVG